MRTLSGIQAERRALRAKMQASEDDEAARRGRRGSVREDVPSENGDNRLGYGSRSPSGVICDPTLEVRRQEDARATRRSVLFCCEVAGTDVEAVERLKAVFGAAILD
ncbi:hypothetical protein PI125_g8030 [Phytophthora idaei]|nr:hypothetical protein PI125_g8030 [Phytophthora idaei]